MINTPKKDAGCLIMECEHYLEVVYKGTVIYRTESLKPLNLSDIKVTIGHIKDRDDVKDFTRHL